MTTTKTTTKKATNVVKKRPRKAAHKMTKKAAKKSDHGTTKSGKRITPRRVAAWAAEAERGYDLDKLPRRGRPTLGSGPARTLQVRVEPELHQQVTSRAATEGITESELVRAALRSYLGR